MTISLPAAEVRRLPLAAAGCEVRENSDGAPQFVGHAAVFDTRTAIGNPLTWGFYEEVARGAFTKTLGEGDARFLVDHDTSKPISRVSAGTLRLAEDRVGLAVDSDLNTAKSYVADLVENLRDSTVTGMSFGFRVIQDDWRTETVSTSDGQTAEVEVRTLVEVQLLEVSAVTFPAYEDTDAGLRSAFGVDELELRDVAAALVRRGDLAALERRSVHRPELNGFRHLFRAPAETTRDDDTGAGAPTPGIDLQARMHGLAVRYGLPTGTADNTSKE